jgi:putative protease
MGTMKQPKLLAPAGDMEGALTALKYGADALYCGGPLLQLRADTAGMDEETLSRVIRTAHDREKLVYVTVNSFVYSREIPALAPYAKRLETMGADGLIVSDIGALAEIRNAVPHMELHLSTQANCMNYKAAQVYYDLGVRRIVLARELSLAQIAEIRAHIPDDLELEAFVHGAMCMAYSGRCLISSFLTGRSANRGDCTQSCRWNYHLTEEKRPGEYFPVVEEAGGTALLSSRELCTVAFLDRLQDAGVSCFKIEGRMRTPYSIGVTVNAYRMAMDKTAPVDALLRELDTTSHRPYCSGFYLEDPLALVPDTGGYVRNWLFVATASEEASGGVVPVQTRNRFAVGDTLEVVSPGQTGRAFKVGRILDESGQELPLSNVPMRLVTVDCPHAVQAGDLFRKAIG